MHEGGALRRSDREPTPETERLSVRIQPIAEIDPRPHPLTLTDAGTGIYPGSPEGPCGLISRTDRRPPGDAAGDAL